jgi:ABC-type lipoprotein export system ATPase subunit
VRGESVVALDGVALDVQPGQFTVLSGPSGSGKSTLLALIGALDRPTRGTVRIDGRDITKLRRVERRTVRRRVVATMLPLPADNLFARRTARANVEAVARLRGVADVAPHATALLEQAGVIDLAEQSCTSMSGGEQQRVALACALAGRPRVVLVDEPTGALDAISAATVIQALRAVARAGATVVVATHDAAVLAVADDVVRLDHGRLA